MNLKNPKFLKELLLELVVVQDFQATHSFSGAKSQILRHSCTVLCIGSLILIGFFLIILLSNACESRHSVLPLLKTILGFLLTLSSFVYVYFVGFIHNSISTVVVEKYSVKVFQNKVPLCSKCLYEFK